MAAEANPSIRTTRVGACRVVAFSGELDLATAGALRRALVSGLSPETPWLIIDLSGAPFCDSSGMRALIGAHRTARALGGGARVAAPHPTVRAVLQRVGLHRLLPIHDCVSEAIKAVPAHNGVGPTRAQRTVPTSVAM
jgi:anti-anti-sigma factor